jgi:hypothetical protein
MGHPAGATPTSPNRTTVGGAAVAAVRVRTATRPICLRPPAATSGTLSPAVPAAPPGALETTKEPAGAPAVGAAAVQGWLQMRLGNAGEGAAEQQQRQRRACVRRCGMKRGRRRGCMGEAVHLNQDCIIRRFASCRGADRADTSLDCAARVPVILRGLLVKIDWSRGGQK